jgi:hypothetical protein
MKKVFALAVASLFSVVAIQAQTKTDKAEVQWGPDMDIKTDGQFGSVMDDVNDAVFLSMSSKKGMADPTHGRAEGELPKAGGNGNGQR